MIERGWRGADVLVLVAVALMGSTVEAAAQARGVIIQIPDDVAPGSQRPTPAPPVQTLPPTGQPSAAPSGAAPGPAKDAGRAACLGAACTPDPNAWHVLNTANRTCLVLSKNALKGGKDVRRLTALLPAPLFVVASGACP